MKHLNPLAALALLLVLAHPLAAADLPLAVNKTASRIDVAVKATMDSFTGTLTAYEATLTADPAAKTVTAATLKFRFADFDTDNKKRNKEMHHWQDTEKCPDCAFTLAALEPSATPGRYTARGTFALHGTTQPLVFPVTITFTDAGACTIDGEAPIDTRAYGLPVIKKFGLLKVDPVVTVKFHLEAAPAQP